MIRLAILLIAALSSSGAQDAGRGKGTLTEWVRAGEEDADSDDLISIQFLEGRKGSAIEAVHQLFQLQNAKYSSVQHAVLEQDDFSVLYEWLLIGSDPHPDQHEVARMIEGHQGLHRVAYVHKGGRLTEAERAEWMDLLRSSKVILGSEPIR